MSQSHKGADNITSTNQYGTCVFEKTDRYGPSDAVSVRNFPGIMPNPIRFQNAGVTCSPKTDPGVMRVYRPCGGKETLDEAQEA